MILADISGGDGFAQTIVAALNSLTHPNAVRLGDRVAGKVFKDKYGTPYKTIVADQGPPADHPHANSWRLLGRMLAHPLECKIKASPGLDYGTQYDPTSTADDATGIGGGTTTPKALKDAGAREKIVWAPYPAQTKNVLSADRAGFELVPAFMVLAHELSHADRIMRGTSLLPRPGSVSGMAPEGSIAGAEGLGATRVDWEHVEMVGFTVTGYVCKDADVVTENQMRGEHGIKARFNY